MDRLIALQLLPKITTCRFLFKSKIWTWLKGRGVVVGMWVRELTTCVSVAKELNVTPKSTVLRGVRIHSIGATDCLSFVDVDFGGKNKVIGLMVLANLAAYKSLYLSSRLTSIPFSSALNNLR